MSSTSLSITIVARGPRCGPSSIDGSVVGKGETGPSHGGDCPRAVVKDVEVVRKPATKRALDHVATVHHEGEPDHVVWGWVLRATHRVFDRLDRNGRASPEPGDGEADRI